jgi:gas vesicle protein
MGLLATGLVAGLVLGIGVALLFAPQSGSDTRRAVSRRLRRVRRRGRDAWDELRDELHRARRELQRARRRRRESQELVEDAEPADA